MRELLEMIKNDSRFSVQYKDRTSDSFGIFLYDYPEFSGAEKNYDDQSVAGRLGSLVGKDISKGNLEITCTFSVLHPSFMAEIREIKRWLSGTGELILSEYPEIYYAVQKVNYGSIERELRHYGRFAATFVCTPFEYLVEGKRECEIREVLFNPYCVCHPIYRITGEGSCSLHVNGNTMSANVGQNLTIDTERMMAYRSNGELQNTSVTGDYENMYLKEGENEITITDGFDMKIVPNWGYDV